MSEKISFETSDGVTIVGDYYSGSRGGRTALLLHMRPATRDSWKQFASKLTKNGFSALSIDLRGHGESTKTTDGRMLNFQKMSEIDERASIKDLEAAGMWLEREKGTAPDELVIIGASIGANLALEYLSENKDVPAAVLISPGLDYRGIVTEPLVQELEPIQELFMIAAKDDAPAALAISVLAEKTDATHTEKIYNSGGHGTKLFETQPTLMDEIVAWLKSH